MNGTVHFHFHKPSPNLGIQLLDEPLGTQRGWQSQKLSIGLAEHWPTSLVGSDVQCMDMYIYICVYIYIYLITFDYT